MSSAAETGPVDHHLGESLAALVDGELLLLRVGTGLFQYHAAEGGPFAYCANPSASYSVDS